METVPYRIVVFDFGEPGIHRDLCQVFVPTLAGWAPDDGEPTPDPTLAGNFRIHVAED